MIQLLFIAGGGALGSVLRYLAAGWGQRLTPGVFPLGTLLVNLSGCLAIGYLATLFAGPAVVREEYRLALLIGFLGGFTTFSTFGYESFSLLSDREWGLAGVNLIASNLLGLAAVWLGHRLALAQGSLG
ncbi:MAG: fluoride efflux transporter CrcB [Myxococcota bacterium]